MSHHIQDEGDFEKKLEDVDEDEGNHDDSSNATKWYLIDKDGTFCKIWNFLITLCVIYSLFAVPVLWIFPSVYQWCGDQSKPLDECPPSDM